MKLSHILGRCAQITLQSGEIFVKVLEVDYVNRYLKVFDEEMVKRKIAFEEIKDIKVKESGTHLYESVLLQKALRRRQADKGL
ncbi:hypothetical protein [Parageobacillus thermoglucosidasius]|uniref:hypothetical protein n=1 Tax=Parageobacillus thermoglucosidasius TaxID=1426 RepID=UPI002E202E67|nr:hypothetical protein [Parageobacillus thermoglucosidasius]MED4946532.1 hypothetical protein [Parageobacillus thermoglucosidasius]MED4984915.1 hypothetical protein [Parageobacillus thermoglucosidasius]